MADMDKSALFRALSARLEARLATQRGASLDAADYATNDEAKATSKWDTQGLEASYLAAGQAHLAKETAADLAKLQAVAAAFQFPASRLAPGALLTVDFGDGPEFFLVAPCGAGEVLEDRASGTEVTVITSQTPLFAQLQAEQNNPKANRLQQIN